METHTKTKNLLKTSLKIILSLQLAIMPYYGYSNIDPESFIQSTLKQIQTTNGAEDLKADQTLIDLSIAIETGQVKEYLQKNPLVEKEVDYFLLSHQKVEAVEHYFDAEKKEVVEVVSQTLNLNEYNNRPIYATFKEVQIRYQETDKTLVFEGISEGAVRLRQYIPNMDIIDYISDGETLAILDRKKGLLLVDMILARAHLGLAPVPVAQIPVPVQKTLSGLEADTSQWTKQNIAVEFIHRGARPPDIVIEEIKQKIDKNFDGRDMVMAGDLMISYTDQQGKKHLVQLLKRSEVNGWLNLNYQMLDIMIKVVAPQLMEQKDLTMLEQEIEKLKTENPKVMLDHILSTLFNKQALNKLGLVAEGIQKRIANREQTLSARDTMLFNEWWDSFNEIHPRLVESNRLTEEGKSPVLSSAETGSLLKKPQENQAENKETRAMALRVVADITSKIKKGTTSKIKPDTTRKIKKVGNKIKEGVEDTGKFIKSTPVVVTGLAGVLATGGLYTLNYAQLEVWTTFFYKITSVFNSMGYVGDFAFYKLTSVPHFITTLLLFPGIVITGALLFNPIVRRLEKISSKSVSLGGKVYHPKGYFKDMLNKWEDASFQKKFIGAGMKLYAFGINPFWNHVAYIVGQRHFIAALQKGLNPFEVIDPKSDVGEIAGITKPTKLGLSKTQWSKDKQFDQQRELQNVRLAKQNRIKSLAWQMATLAVAGREKVTPYQIIMYGVTGVNFEDLKKVHNDMELRMEMLWVLRNLEKEIKNLNEVDIRKALSELEPEMIVRYYEKAKQIAKEAKAQPYFFKKTRAFWNTGLMGNIRHRLNLQSISSVNKTHVEILNQVPTDFVTERSWREFTVDHLLVVLMPMLMTNRANLSSEHLYQIALNENFLSHSGRPHIYDVGFNAFQWLFVSGAGNALAYMVLDKVNEFQKSHKPFYEPIEKHTNPIEDKVQSEFSYFKNQANALLPSSAQEDPKMRAGNVWLKHVVATLRSVQLGIIIALILRAGVVGQPVSEALSAWFLIHMAQFWFLGWPFAIIHGGHYISGKQMDKNKEKMEELRLKLSRVVRGIYPDSEALKTDFDLATKELKGLYGDKLWDKWQKTGPHLDSTQGVEAVQKVSEHYMKTLINKPPLPNQMNNPLDYIWTLFFFSVLTTYLGVELFIWTFDANKLRMQNLIEWTGINIALLSFLYLFYRQSLAEHWNDLKTGKKWKARMEKIKHELKDWKKAIESLKPAEQSWNLYFYERMLNLSSSVSQKCQRAFRK